MFEHELACDIFTELASMPIQCTIHDVLEMKWGGGGGGVFFLIDVRYQRGGVPFNPQESWEGLPTFFRERILLYSDPDYIFVSGAFFLLQKLGLDFFWL